jgi:hypothetical protein
MRLFCIAKELIMSKKSIITSGVKPSTKPGAYAIGCAVTCTSFMIPAYGHTHAAIVPYAQSEAFQRHEDLEQQLQAVPLQESNSNAAGMAGHETTADTPVSEQLADMAAELKSQREQITAQNALIAKQQQALDMLLHSGTLNTEAAAYGTLADDLMQQRGSGVSQFMFGSAPLLPGLQTAASALPQLSPQASSSSLPTGPVGIAPPPEPAVEAQVQALPEGQGVLTPAGTLAIDSAFDYTSSSTNRLVFRGFELVPGIQIGLIEASDADRDTAGTSMTVRYGVTNRFEIEARVPALYRRDRIQVAQQRGESIVRELKLKEQGIGDIEFAARYQLSRPQSQQGQSQQGQGPIWVANVRVKSDTGIGPFDVGYDEFGVATGLATGSGFWAVQPGINFLLPSDPAVIFGSLSYLYHIGRDVNRTVGNARIGRVEPGDAISGNLGFGFSLNPRFSFSLGYKHSYIFPSKTTINDTVQKSDRAQVGAFTFGMSYRLTERQSVNIGFDLGATADAPDLGVSIRFPLSFNLLGKRK